VPELRERQWRWQSSHSSNSAIQLDRNITEVFVPMFSGSGISMVQLPTTCDASSKRNSRWRPQIVDMTANNFSGYISAFLRFSNTLWQVCELSDICVSGESEMAAINRKWIRKTYISDFRHDCNEIQKTIPKNIGPIFMFTGSGNTAVQSEYCWCHGKQQIKNGRHSPEVDTKCINC